MIRHSTLIFLLMAGAVAVALFSVKYKVQDMEKELTQLNRATIDARDAIRVLKAEWSHLNNSARLRLLAGRHLGMKPLTPDQMGTLEDLPLLRTGSEGPGVSVPPGGGLGASRPVAGAGAIPASLSVGTSAQ
jgi:cell division protein FtsL